MAYKVNGIIVIDDSRNLSAGIATATEFDGKVSSKAITEQTAGSEADVSGADEVLIYDTDSGNLLRVSVDEFIEGSGIGTIVTDFGNLSVTGVSTVSGVEINAGIVTASSPTGIVTFYGDGSGLTNLPTPSLALNDLSDVSVPSPSTNNVLRYDGLGGWGSQSVTGLLLNQSLNVLSVTTNDLQVSREVGSNLQPGSDVTFDLGNPSFGDGGVPRYWNNLYVQNVQLKAGPTWTSGSGSPEGSVTASVGSMYTRSDGGTGTTLYVKESGSGNTGWVSANPAVAGPNYNQVIVDSTVNYTTNTSTFTDMPALDITITPTSTSSLIKYQLNMNVGQNLRTNGYNVQRKIGAGSFTNISQLQGTGTAGSQGFQCSFSGGNNHDFGDSSIVSNVQFGFIDEWHNTTSEITYRITVRTTEAAGSAKLNENVGLTDRSLETVSTVTVYELK